MLVLVRTVRFCLTGSPDETASPCLNPYAAWPAMRGLSRYYEITVHAAGEADPRTGYFLDIRLMDAAVREAALPILRQAVAGSAKESADTPMGALMERLLAAVRARLGPCARRLELHLTPTFLLAMDASTQAPVPSSLSPAAMPAFLEVRQQYDFAAAHRLAVAGLSDAENARIFGKCSNPAGHGHNYRLEVVAKAPVAADGHTALTRDPATLDGWVDGAVLRRLDHKHLNCDVPEFKERNPSVEHIAQQAWDWLRAATPADCALVEVSVWETEKTRCIVRGDA